MKVGDKVLYLAPNADPDISTGEIVTIEKVVYPVFVVSFANAKNTLTVPLSSLTKIGGIQQ